MDKFYQQLKTLIGNGDIFADTVRNAAGVFAIRFGGAVINFLFTLVLVRFLPQEQVGFVLVTMSMVQIAALFITLNMESGAVRHLLHPLEQGHQAEASGFVHYGIKVIIRMSLLVLPAFITYAALVHFHTTPIIRTEVIAIICAALAIPMIGFIRLTTQSAHALSRIISANLPPGLIQPLFMVTLTAVAGVLLTRLSVGKVMLFYLLAVIFGFALQLLLVGKSFAFMKTRPDLTQAKTWVQTGLYLSITVLLLSYFQNIVLVFAAFGLDDASLAILAIAFRFAVLLRMGVMAINAAIAPSLSKAVAANNQKRADDILRLAAHLKFWPTLIVTGFVWALAPWMIDISFGPDYAQAAWLLRIISFIPVIAAFYGPSLMILNITGNQKRVFPASALSLSILAVSVPVFSLYAGMMGAALAAVITVLLWETALYVRVRYNTIYRPAIFDNIIGRLDPVAEP